MNEHSYRACYRLALWAMIFLAFWRLGFQTELNDIVKEAFNPRAIAATVVGGVFLIGLASIVRRAQFAARFRTIMIEEIFATLYTVTSIAAIVLAMQLPEIYGSITLLSILLAVLAGVVVMLLFGLPRLANYILSDDGNKAARESPASAP